MALTQVHDIARSACGLLSNIAYTSEEELQPVLPFTFIANTLEILVVIRFVEFEEVGQVKKGLAKYSLLAEIESYEQPTHASISIEEGVYGLELGMGEADPDKGGHWRG